MPEIVFWEPSWNGSSFIDFERLDMLVSCYNHKLLDEEFSFFFRFLVF